MLLLPRLGKARMTTCASVDAAARVALLTGGPPGSQLGAGVLALLCFPSCFAGACLGGAAVCLPIARLPVDRALDASFHGLDSLPQSVSTSLPWKRLEITVDMNRRGDDPLTSGPSAIRSLR